jgi:hypothetical protein
VLSAIASLQERGGRRREFDQGLIKILDDRPAGGDLQVVFPGLPREVLLEGIAPSEGIAQRPEVRWVEEAGVGNMDCDAAAERTPGGLTQSGHVGCTPIWDRNIQGQGQIIGVTDRPPNVAHCMFFDNGTAGPAHRKLAGNRHRRGFDMLELHGQRVAALAAGHGPSGGLRLNRGMAWRARLSLDDQLPVFDNEASFLAVLTNQAADGAFIHSNSWHKGSKYNQSAVTTDAFVWNHEENLVCGSSGNDDGQEVIGPPGSAKNSQCVSASRNHSDQMTLGDGVAGPVSAADLRLKPEICAPGCDLATAGRHACDALDIDCASS